MSEVNKELVRRHFEELFNRRDLAVADELMAEDYLEHAVAPFGQAEPGRVNGLAVLSEGTNLGPLNGVVPPLQLGLLQPPGRPPS